MAQDALTAEPISALAHLSLTYSCSSPRATGQLAESRAEVMFHPSAAVILIGASRLAHGLQIVAVSNTLCCHLFLRDSRICSCGSCCSSVVGREQWRAAGLTFSTPWAHLNACAASTLCWSGHAGLQQELPRNYLLLLPIAGLQEEQGLSES